MSATPTRRTLANALRILSMEAVQKANSGHPGMPMGMADIAESLWRGALNHNPNNPQWRNRDRFVLSNGHGSMLLYSLLHLTGYDLSLDDLKNFRQLHSKTAGHPEFGLTAGVETTTGPLGQGIANAVGLALGEKLLAAEFNRENHAIIDHYTYTFLGDGCLMEGISHEVCSLAGTWGLGKLIVFYDDNNISIDGEVGGWFTDNTPARFEAYGWQVIPNVDGHDSAALDAAIIQAKNNQNQPTLICCKTTIGFGSPNKQGTRGVHGAPLGAAEMAHVRQTLDWEHEGFEIPDHIYAQWDARAQGELLEKNWNNLWDLYQKNHPELAENLKTRWANQVPEPAVQALHQFVQTLDESKPNIATRKASENTLHILGPKYAGLLGGSADLTESNLTLWKGAIEVKPNQMAGNYLYYGVREFGMSAIMNGLALYGAFVPYGGTFLVFSDYARNAIRMSALMNQRVIYVLTHDSVALGEDGPTHQPIEHIPSLRLIPNVHVWRPCDALETALAWQSAIQHDKNPSILALSRQNLPSQTRTPQAIAEVMRGAYVLHAVENPQVVLIATGSEVNLAMQAAEQLAAQNIRAQVVSAPCLEIFANEDHAYQNTVLLPNIPRIAIEAARTDGWWRWVAQNNNAGGAVIGIDRFGESAPGAEVMAYLGVTAERVVETARGLVG